MEIYLNVIVAQALTRNDVRNSEIIMELDRRIRAYIDSWICEYQKAINVRDKER
jgi:hypothetical protein